MSISLRELNGRELLAHELNDAWMTATRHSRDGHTEVSSPSIELAESATEFLELAGISAQRKRLKQAWADVRQGSTRTVFVRAEAREKNSLIEDLLRTIRKNRDAVILEGRCKAVGSGPFQAMSSLVDSLAVFLETLHIDVVRALMPDDSLPLTRLFPQLRQFANESPPSISNSDKLDFRRRVLTGLRELLTRISDLCPLLLYMDDLQASDAESASMLADLAQSAGCPRMLLLGSYRCEIL